MNIAAIDIPAGEAAERLAEYTAQLASERTAEDAAIAAGYRAAARGHQVFRLSQAVMAGGWCERGLPRIAVARADATVCHVRWDGTDLVYSETGHWDANRGALVGQRSLRVSPGRPAPLLRPHGFTMVPPVPPRHRPRPQRLHGFHVLWEVTEWEMVPPTDPALIRWIGGDLWSLHATWDLTDLERAVLSQRDA
jgi:hypothetical protein